MNFSSNVNLINFCYSPHKYTQSKIGAILCELRIHLTDTMHIAITISEISAFNLRLLGLFRKNLIYLLSVGKLPKFKQILLTLKGVVNSLNFFINQYYLYTLT